MVQRQFQYGQKINSKMKYLKIFEEFNNEFPDVFNGTLKRGVKIDKDEYIDDPKLRKVSTGDSDEEHYREFLANYSKLGIPDPTKSVHMYFRPIPNNDSYGNQYDIIPKSNAIFGFCKHIRYGNGTLGNTYFGVNFIVKEYMNKDIGIFDDYFTDYYEDKNKYLEEITDYQRKLVDLGLVGILTYDELIKMSKEKGETLQVWTESPCLHRKITKPSKEPKEPKTYKNEPILNDDDFKELGIDNKSKGEFYRQYGKEINRTDVIIPIGRRRRMALDILKKWALTQ